jgi:hypothetical protein
VGGFGKRGKCLIGPLDLENSGLDTLSPVPDKGAAAVIADDAG